METKKPTANVLFWDIETSPNVGLFWRSGQNLSINYEAITNERKIITIAWKWLGSKKTESLTWDNSQNDLSMLKAFMEVAQKADVLVAHYGDRFDLPWFRTRCLFHGLEPLPAYKTVDTKAWASKYFYFNSCSLNYIANALGFGQKSKTEFDWWKRITMHNDRQALALMEKYNKRDVELLEKVYLKLEPHCPIKTHVGVLNGGEKWSCPRCGSTNVRLSKKRVTAAGTLQYQMQCKDDGSYFTISHKAYTDFQEHLQSK